MPKTMEFYLPKTMENSLPFTRRQIQELQSIGAVDKPERKNEYGHLQYDDKDIEKLWELKFYKELGYKNPEIVAISNKKKKDKSFNKKEELQRVILELKDKKRRLENTIAIAEFMLETGIEFNGIRHNIPDIEDRNAKEVISLLGAGLKTSKIFAEDENYNYDILLDADLENLFEVYDDLMEDYQDGKQANDNDVQKKIGIIHNVLKDYISESIYFLQVSLILLSPESDISKDIGEKKAAFLRDAIQQYCILNQENEVDKEFFQIIDNIERLAYKKYATNSLEVQSEVRKIHEFFKNIKILSELGIRHMLQNLSILYGSDSYKEIFDNGKERGISWFFSRALEIYFSAIE